MLFALLKGFLFGLYIGVPTGPVGALCIARVLDRGFWSGIWTGAGSVLSDILYALVFVLGLRGISNFFTAQMVPIRIGGGALLIAIGAILFVKKVKQHIPVKKHEQGGDFLSGFLITLSNPVQLVSYSIFFATLNIAHFSAVQSALFIVGIFVGTSVWWVVLSWFVSKFKKGISLKTNIILHKVIACIVIVVGGVVIMSSI